MVTKEEYEQRVESELETAGVRIEAWSAKAERSDRDVKFEYEQNLDLLREIRSQAHAHLEELKQAGEGSWGNVRTRLDGVLSELRNAILNVSSRFE